MLTASEIKMSKSTKILIAGLILFGAALIIVLIQNVFELVNYKMCMNTPITELSESCKASLQIK